jgi:hypothetical protein
MRTLRLCVCLLVSGMLCILGGCKKAGFRSHDYDVGINNCVASSKTVTVQEGDGVDWHADNHDYTIRFKNQSEPAPNPIPVPHGGSHRVTIKGHGDCDHPVPGEFYCKYSVTRDNESKPCADFDDPGIHIVP